MDIVNSLINCFVHSFVIIVFYLLLTCIIRYIYWKIPKNILALQSLHPTKRLFLVFIFQLCFIIFIPIVCLIFTHSFPYFLFILGFLLHLQYGYSNYDLQMKNLSQIQKKYGQTIMFFANLIGIIGFLWGMYNIIFF